MRGVAGAVLRVRLWAHQGRQQGQAGPSGYEQPLSGGTNSSGIVGPDANGRYWITSLISGQGQVRALDPPTWIAA